jgi:hypothetical protein
MKFELFRIKITEPVQSDLFFDKNLERSKILHDAVHEKIEIPLSDKRREWHIGNVEYINENASAYLLIGRKAISKIHKIDRRTGNFYKSNIEDTPNTEVIINFNLSVIAIHHNYALSENAYATAKKFCELLSTTTLISKYKLKLTVGAMSNPDNFLETLHEAYAIKKLTYEFSRPNPFDADALCVKPLELLAKESYASEGVMSLTGERLNFEVIQSISKSAAATGDDVRARYQAKVNTRPVSISLKQNTASIDVETTSSRYGKENLTNLIVQKWKKIRGEYE